MKRLVLSVFCAVVACFAGGVARADDAAEARKAFDMFVLYTQTDDERLPDLFASDVATTFFYDAGQGVREITLPADKFREMITKSLAKKEANSDKYEDIQCQQDGDTVRLTCTRIYGKSDERGPLTVVYAKDGSGAFKIKAMRAQIPPPKVSPGS